MRDFLLLFCKFWQKHDPVDAYILRCIYTTVPCLYAKFPKKSIKKSLIIFFLFLQNFNTLHAETPKQKLELSAEKIDFINGKEGERYIKAKGNVEVLYSEYKLCSDELILNEKEDNVKARKNVRLMERAENGAVIKTDSIDGNRDISRASIASFTMEKDKIYGVSSGGEKRGEIIKIKGLKVSSCANAKTGTADWSLYSNNAKYDKENDQITLYNTLFYAKSVPVMWLPYFTISPSRTHGFLAPEAGFYNDQLYISTPYFISEKTKTHYAIIKPEFYRGSSSPENKSRVNNLYGSYAYKKGNNEIFLEGKVAQKAYSQTEALGLASDEKETRYYLNSSGNFEYSKGNYGLKYGEVSDRFFRKTYDFKTENYLEKSAYFNFFSEDNKHSSTSDVIKFVPIAFPDTKTLPTIDLLSNYKFETGFNQNIKIYDEINFISVSRQEGVNYKRISNSAGFEMKANFGQVKTVINPELRGDFYSKNYTLQLEGEKNETLQLGDGKNETFSRLIPSLFIENKLPIYLKLKDNSDYLFKLEPQLNFFWAKEGVNSERIISEDSSNAFLNADTVLSKKYISGYDVIDEGLSGIYGASFEAKHKKSGSFGTIFLGQRAKVYLEDSLQNVNYSSYAGKFDMGLFNTFSFSANTIFSEDFKLQYSTTTTGLNFTFITFSFQNTFIEKDLVRRNQDINENRYGVTVKFLDYNSSFTANLVQNNKFLEKTGEVVKKIVYSEYIFNHLADCFEYSVGVRKERYTIQDEKNKYQVFGKFRLLFI
jgi:lipopolysaccharide assembly outer membrane protein LptD (OstA)